MPRGGPRLLTLVRALRGGGDRAILTAACSVTEGLGAGRPGEGLQLGWPGLEGGEAPGGGGGRDQSGGETVGRPVAALGAIVGTGGTTLVTLITLLTTNKHPGNLCLIS